MNNKINLLHNKYFKRLSRGGLIARSHLLTCLLTLLLVALLFKFCGSRTCKSKGNITVTVAAAFALYQYSLKRNLTREENLDWQHKFGMIVLVKIFFNNKQKETNDTVRKDASKRDSG